MKAAILFSSFFESQNTRAKVWQRWLVAVAPKALSRNQFSLSRLFRVRTKLRIARISGILALCKNPFVILQLPEVDLAFGMGVVEHDLDFDYSSPVAFSIATAADSGILPR